MFELDEEKIAVARDPKGDGEEAIWEAAESCPVDAIFLYDEETGEQLYP